GRSSTTRRSSRTPRCARRCRGCRSLRPVGPIWRRRGGMGRLRTTHRLHRPTLVVPAAVAGVGGGYPGNGSRSNCRRWTAGRVSAPLVGIRGGGVTAQFRAGDDVCARGESPDRLLRLDGGRRGISARGGRAPGTWRRGHPQIRRRRPLTGSGRPGTGDPEGCPLNCKRGTMMRIAPVEEVVDGLPNLCGAEGQVEEVTRARQPVFLPQTNLHLDRLQAVFAVALHMHQPLIPAGGGDLRHADVISNLDHMMRSGDDYNANIFADCYGRMGDIIPELVREGRQPRVMLDYSGELLYGLRKMGRGDVLDRLRGITCDPHMRKHVEWLGTMWGHAVASSTPLPDLKLQMRAWQQQFAAVYGWEALGRVRGFSPPEMHLPNHPDAAFEYVKALKECGYRWLLVQEHTVETLEGHGLGYQHLPHPLLPRNSAGEEISIVAIIKTQGSDTKLVAQMQPFYEAQGLQPRELGGIRVPPLVTQIGDGENGGVMMNEFPSGYRQAIGRFGTEGVVNVNVTEYLEMLEQAGV